MEHLGNREDRGQILLTKKVARREESAEREGKNSEACQVIKSPLTLCQLNETTAGGTLARIVPSGDMRVHYADGLTQDTFKICKEFLRPFKKSLRKLNLPKDFPKEKRLRCTRKNLTILGDHINMFLQHYCKTWELKHWKKMLWRFVSLFSALDEKQLCKLYRYSKTDQITKFLKAYCRLENPGFVTLPNSGKRVKLRDTWRVAGGVKQKLGQMPSPSRACDLPAGNVPTKRRSRTREKKVMKNEETGTSSTLTPHSRLTVEKDSFL